MSSNDSQEDRGLRLNRQDRKLLGVCGGFARYLDVPAGLVRLIYIVACLVSPVLILVYFVLYWCLKEDTSPGKVRVYVSDSDTAQHFKRLDYHRPLYRSRDSNWIGGVCGGIAEYLNISPAIVRIVTLLSLFILGAVTFWAYIVCWIILDKRPRGFAYHSGNGTADKMAAEAQSQRQYEADIRSCAATLEEAEARLREMEAFMTSKRFRLHCEINRI